MKSLSRLILTLESLQQRLRGAAVELEQYLDEIDAEPLPHPAELRDAAECIDLWIDGLRHQEIA
jgi:hypothetical protein